jgi:methionine synthase / methylenetetrahydrofolate reductase(NADPH)
MRARFSVHRLTHPRAAQGPDAQPRKVADMEPLVERWQRDVLLADGAMGTLLFARSASTSCVELFNVTAPDMVESAHGEYVDAGAQIIESNTFAANRLKLRAHEAAGRVAEINTAGIEIARRAAGDRAYVAGSIGPIGALLRPIGSVDQAEAFDVFAEHALAIASARPDMLLLETFGGVEEALIAVRAARTSAPRLPILVSLSVVDDGRTPEGDELLPAFRRLLADGADGVGINCAVGPQAVYDALAPIIVDLTCPVSVMPNAGYPRRVDDRTVYGSTPHYFARFARAFFELGATIIGGCCGTTSAHIAAMAPEIVGKTRHARTRQPAIHVKPRSATDEMRPAVGGPTTSFERDLGRRFVTTAEIAPPRGADAARMLEGARMLAAAGADALHIADNASSRPAMSGATAAYLVARETKLASVLHVSCRDRNLVGLQSDLIGAATLGVTAIVALTGDPSNVGDFPKATSVFDVTALGLTKILKMLNDGFDHAGTPIGAPTRFRIGAAVNALPRDIGAENARLLEKIAAGADFAITQPVFEASALAPFLERASDAGIPLLVGLLPLRGYAHAEYLHNEIPGMQIPEAVRERLRTAADGTAEGIAIARELVEEMTQTGGVAGAYVVSLERYEAAAEVIASAHRASRATSLS